VVRHELPESERFCANDGHALVEIGVETSEQIDVIPEQVRSGPVCLDRILRPLSGALRM
jgi:transposase